MSDTDDPQSPGGMEGASTVDASSTEAPREDDVIPFVPALPAFMAGHEILGLLGKGGMGVVYKARHPKLKRLVALQMIRAGEYAGAEERERFRTEAEAAARLQHPNVVQIYEVGEESGLSFLALEYVDGGSLADRLARTPLPPRQAAEMVQVLARAVHAAHQQG